MPMPDNACACEQCQKMCEHPCWGTPEDIEALISAGYAEKLMLDYWVRFVDDSYDPILIVCPASRGCERRMAETFSWTPCVFQAEDTKLCALH